MKKLKEVDFFKLEFLSLIFLTLLLFVPNLKSYFLLFLAISIFFYFFYKKSILETLWLSLLLCLPFEVGKSMRTSTYYLPKNIIGETYFYITMANFFTISLLWYFLRNKRLLSQARFYWWEVSLLIFLLLSFISSLVSIYPLISYLFFLQIIGTILFYFLGRTILSTDKTLSLIKETKIILITHILFQGALAVVQYLKGGLLHKFIEEAFYQYNFGHFATEEKTMFRASGTMSHPNNLASFLLILLPLAFFELFSKKPRFYKNIFYLAAFIFGLGGLITTMSRGAWLIFFANCFAIYFFIKKEKLRFNPILKKLALLLILPLIIILPDFFSRLTSLSRAFAEKGSALVRLDLTKEAIFLMTRSPIFGIGPGLFIPILIERHLTDVINIFPSQVHNTFLLIGAELGSVALFSFLFFFAQVLKKSFFNKNKNSDLSIFWGGIFGLVNFFLLSLGYPIFKPGLLNIVFLLAILLISQK